MVTLFGLLETGSRALFAQQTGLAVTGNNISNVNTPGYSRQRVNLVTTPDLRLEPAPIGTGVRVQSIERLRSAFLDAQIRQETSRLGYYTQQGDILSQLEVLFNDPITLSASSLDDTAEAGLNSTLTEFFDALQEVSLEPESTSVRTALEQQAQVLVSTFNLIAVQLQDLREEVNTRVQNTVDEINGLLKSIYDVNQQIGRLEVGQGDQANNLRDQRDLLITQLSSYIPLDVTELDSGAVNVKICGINAVQPSSVTYLEATGDPNDPTSVANVVFADTGGQILDNLIVSGELGGLLNARDKIIPFYSAQLDTLAHSLIYEVNRIHSGAAGLKGFEQITGTSAVRDPASALASAGLDFPVQAGTFTLVVRDADGEVSGSYDITVDPTADSLTTLAAAIDAADGTVGGGDLTATVTGDYRLRITAGTGLRFTFQGDSSGALAALGVNTFFIGTDAGSIAVNSVISNDVNYIAASSDGTEGNNEAILLMAQLRNAQTMLGGKADFHEFYQGMIAQLGTEGRAAAQLESNTSLLVDSLETRQEELAGVSIDEETVNLLKYQRAFAAAARFITSVDQLTQTVVEGMGIVGR
jgi:flagellar hook-associated protein 1 FlgK